MGVYMMRRVVFPIVLAALLINVRPVAGVEFGWQPLPDGGIEYLIQVEPQLIDSFREFGYSSDLPTGLRDIRRVRIVVGTEPLPNQGDLVGPVPPMNTPPVASTPPDREPTFSSDPPAGSTPMPEPSKFVPDPGAKAVPAANIAEVTPAPAIKPDEAKALASSIQDTVAKPNSSTTSEPTTEKPWWLLMFLLFALFLSLGANTYLVWIHQGLRARYRSLINRPSPTAA